MFTLYLFSEYLHWLSEIVHAWLKSGGVCVPTCNKLQHLSLRKIIKIIKNQLFPLSAHLHRVHFINGEAVVWLRPPRIDSLSLSLPPDKLHFWCLLNSNSDCAAHTHTHTQASESFSWLRFIRAGFHALFAKESTAALHSARGLITVFGNQLNWTGSV